jgi:hypothetical protein
VKRYKPWMAQVAVLFITHGISDKICVMRAGPASTIAQVVYETLAGHRAPRYTALADQTRLASAIERKRSVSGAIG